MKARPKFQQGEEVILECNSHPHLNGEYTVIHVIETTNDRTECYHPGVDKHFTFNDPFRTLFVYDIGNILDHPYATLCNEHTLRKKHKPSEFSFDDLMANINSKIQEPVR